MKIIKRVYIDDIDEKVDVHKRGNFVAKGIWSNGRLVYSRIYENNEDEGMFYQIRSMKYHMLIMVRV